MIKPFCCVCGDNTTGLVDMRMHEDNQRFLLVVECYKCGKRWNALCILNSYTLDEE
jgi:transcriptional regulator NrdR family protein